MLLGVAWSWKLSLPKLAVFRKVQIKLTLPVEVQKIPSISPCLYMSFIANSSTHKESHSTTEISIEFAAVLCHNYTSIGMPFNRWFDLIEFLFN